MPRPSKTKRDKPTFIEEARRAQIVEAAQAIFLQEGFEKATISQIAKSIGVSKGVILYHFGNKSDLGKTVIEGILNAYGSHIAEQLSKQKTAAEKVLAFPMVCANFIEDNQDNFILYLDTLGSFGDIEQKRSYMAQANQIQRDYLVRLINEAKKDGDITGVNAAALADTIQGFVDGINSQFCADPSVVNPVQCAKLFRNLLRETIST